MPVHAPHRCISHRLPLLLIASAALITAESCFSADSPFWPRFLGPDGSAAAPADTPTDAIPLNWSATENLQWKAQVPGPGSSSPIVWKDRIFLTCWTGYGTPDARGDVSKLTRHLLCYGLADGRLLWQADVPAELPEDPFEGFLTEHGYATHTPVTDGRNIYVFFGKSGALAFDWNGKKLWQTPLGQSSSAKRWGSAASPILYEDKLIINASDESRSVVALDTASGSILWKAEGDRLDSAYGTPTLVTRGGQTDLILALPQEVWGLNPDTGKLRWFAEHRLPGNVSPSVILGADRIFIFGGYPATGTVAYKLGGRGDITSSHEVWRTNTSSYVPTPLLYQDHLYVINDQGFATCIDARTGKDAYRERAIQDGPRGRGKPFYASPIRIGDRIYCVSRKSGTFVLAARPQFELLARNIIADDDSQFNATPAVAGSTLLLRSERYLYAIGKR